MKQMDGFRVGYDIGNVILSNDTDSASDQQTQHYVDGSVETLANIVNTVSPNNVFLISKCGPKMQASTLKQFDSTDFFSKTGLDPDNVFFCRARSDKAGIAAELGLDQFTDDRLDILRSMGMVRQRLLFQRQDRPPLSHEVLAHETQEIQIARGWPDVWQAIVSTH